jgi:hypothetical protein
VPLVGRLLTLMTIGMLVGALFVGFLGVTTTKSNPSVKSVSVTTPNPVVHITSAVGSIRVVPIPAGDPTKANAVTVDSVTEVRHLSPFLAEQNLKGSRIEPTIGDNGEIYINTQPDGDGEIFSERSTTATVYVPQGTRLNMTVRFGVASVTGLSGPATIEVSGGLLNIVDTTLSDGSRIILSGGTANLDAVTLNGRADLAVNGGYIELHGALGSNTALNVSVNGGNANLYLPLATDARLTAHANGGDLNVSTTWTGTINRSRATSGSQQITGALSSTTNTTNTITLDLNGGGISLRPQSANSPRPVPATPEAPAAPAMPEAPLAPRLP